MLNIKITKNIFIFILFLYSLFCVLTVGQGWDEIDNYIRGKITLDYLFSLGRINEDAFLRESYSTFYWSIKYLLSNIFPKKYLIESGHFINLIFSLTALFGVKKIAKELFNNEIGNLSFLILFFVPFFFGHFGVNGKDTVLAVCHIWIFVYLIKYLKTKNKKTQTNSFFKIGVFAALGTGIQLVFLGSLLPIILFFILEIFYFKNIINQSFSLKKLLVDIFKSFLIFYSLLILFWIDSHSNILLNPIKFLINIYSENYPTGWKYNLSAGKYYLSENISWSYLLENLFFKLPEYFIFSYAVFLFLIAKYKLFFIKHFKYFWKNLVLILFLIAFPTLLLTFLPFPIYDGLRLFLWIVPYLCVVPALVIYFLIKNYKNKVSILISFVLLPLIILFLKNFISYTPYHYSYLNSFNNFFEDRQTTFEVDYWGLSLNELIKRSDINNNEKFIFTVCGVNEDNVKYYLKKNGIYNFEFNSELKSDYVVLTNRATFFNNEVSNCLFKFDNVNEFEVKRNNILLSAIRKNSLKEN